MKTKEFIKMLQEADPSGECHIRMPGGVPRFAEQKEGYWDGPYSYIDEDMNWVHSSAGSKVDIHCWDIDDYVYDSYYRGSKTWEDVEKKIKFDLTYAYKPQRDEREQGVLKDAKESFDNIKEITDRMYNESLNEMIKNSENGWTWFQNKKVDLNEKPNMHIFYTWKVYTKDGTELGSNLKNTESVQKSGLWERVDNGVKDGYYQWIKK